MITCGPFICKETLGKGGYATVKLAEHSETGQKCALKMMKSTGVSDFIKETFKSEVSIMKELAHPNIIKIFDFSDEEEYKLPDGRSMEVYSIALELAQNGEIFDFIAETGRFSEPLSRYYFHQLVNVIEHMHKNGIVHRDIKPENVLLDSKYNIKLTDFGFAEHQTTSTVKKGTNGYMAPEMYNYEEFCTQPLDIFALGVLLFIMVKGSPPFQNAKQDDQYYKLFLNDTQKFWNVHFRKFKDDLPTNQLIDLLTKMLSHNPSERITISEIKESEWFNGPLPTPEDVYSEMAARRQAIEEENMEMEE
jgi:serine/threonine protein kinase